MSRVPFFPLEQRSQLCVQTQDRVTRLWSEPRAATVDDLVSAIHELSPEQQATVISQLGVVPKTIGDRLERAEWVFDALSDAQQAIDRFREYRKQFPEKREGDVVDAEFKEVDES
jgi:hypothetical protein